MIEDKLTTEQRLRLECLAQANVSLNHLGGASPSRVLDAARQYQDYVSGKEEQ